MLARAEVEIFKGKVGPCQHQVEEATAVMVGSHRSYPVKEAQLTIKR
jgi:hypothetical protein